MNIHKVGCEGCSGKKNEPHLWRLLNFRFPQSSKRNNGLSFGLYTYQHEKTMSMKSNNRLQMAATVTLICVYHYLIF